MARSFEVSINPEIIKWARQSAGFSIGEIAKKLKTSVENYKKIEAGEKALTYRQIEVLSRYFKRPVAVFFLPEPPIEPSLATCFRILPKEESKLSKDLRVAIRKARHYQSIVNDLMKEMRIDPEPNIERFGITDNPVEIAQKERRKIGINVNEQFRWRNAYEAFNAWRNAIEKLNILIFQFKFPIEDARGFSLIEKNPPLIAINSSDNILARIFTLFHEYAHILLRITEIYVGEEEMMTDKNVETWCNRFASEFLIPEKALRGDENFKDFIGQKYLTSEILENLSNKFKVSKQAVLTRLRTLDLIDNEIYEKRVLDLQKQSQEIPQKRGFITPIQKCIQEKGKKFISVVLEGKERGIITTADTIEYLSLKLKYVDKIHEAILR